VTVRRRRSAATRSGIGPAAARRLMAEAEQARRRAYAPYSKFSVGAALLLDDGTVVHGCNIENASYGLAMCAERTAIFRALTEGRRRFVAIAVTAGPRMAASPCGACRQVMHEFAPDLEVVWRGRSGRLARRPLARLLSHAFDFGTARVRRSPARKK